MPTEPWDGRGQTVTCRDCGATYTCTPERDYYHEESIPAGPATGACWDCMLRAKGYQPCPEPRHGGGLVRLVPLAAPQPQWDTTNRDGTGRCKDCASDGPHDPTCPWVRRKEQQA